MQIIPAKLHDILEIFEIDKRANQTSWALEDYQFIFHTQTEEIFILQDEHQLIGFVVFKIILDTLDIWQIVIDNQFKNQGYGSALLKFIQQYARQHAILNIILEVRVNNIQALNLYTKHGFKVVNMRKNYYKLPDQTIDAYLMECRL